MKFKIYLITVLLYLLSLILPGSLKAAENLSFVHQDHLGSTTLMTDSSGKKASKQVYYPYGDTRAKEGNLSTERHYTGQVSDADDTGLLYYNARYYDPKIGKFTQADTADAGSNRYSYVNGNPLKFVDPSGHQTGCPFWELSCLKEAFYSDLNGIKEAVTGFARSWADNPEETTDALALNALQVVAFAGASYLGGPAFAEAVDATLCAATGGGAACALAAQTPGPNVSSKIDDLSDNLAIALEDSKAAVERDLLQHGGHLYAYDNTTWDTVLPNYQSALGLRNRSGIFVRETGDITQTLDTLGHEYMHEIHLRNFKPGEHTWGAKVDSEIFAWGEMANAPYLPDEIRRVNQTAVDWFGRQRAKGFTDARIYMTYADGGYFPYKDIPNYNSMTGVKNFRAPSWE